MQEFFRKHHRPVFYLTWLTLNLIQAGFTELQDDEAYYWVYSKFLDWGYFDHPPMTALLIKGGSLLFSGELAVRFFPVLLNLLTICITEKLINEKKEWPLKQSYLFYAICFSISLLQLSGFMAVPDVPLMFFTALFLLIYKHYLQRASWKNALLLGVVAALLMYSKYHGVIIVFFILLSNLKLLKDIRIYAAGLVALLLFSFHLYWQYEHDWISFKYHLFESNVNQYRFRYTLEYVLGQLLIAGPIAGFILLPASLIYRPKDIFERALKFTLAGIFIFFLLSSFKGKVEANWTSPALVPLIVLSYYYLREHASWRKWLYRLLPVTALFVIFARLVMLFNFIPSNAINKRYHAWKDCPEQMKQNTRGLDIVFINSYQRASKYWFYTGQMTYSFNDYKDRRNNFNFWPVEDSILGKPVYILDVHNRHLLTDSIQIPGWTLAYRYDSSFYSFAKLMIQPDKKEYTIRSGDSLDIKFNTGIPAHYRKYLLDHPRVDANVILGVFNGRELLKDIETGLSVQQLNQRPEGSIILPSGLPKGKYILRFAIGSGTTMFSHNSEKIGLTVE